MKPKEAPTSNAPIPCPGNESYRACFYAGGDGSDIEVLPATPDTTNGAGSSMAEQRFSNTSPVSGLLISSGASRSVSSQSGVPMSTSLITSPMPEMSLATMSAMPTGSIADECSSLGYRPTIVIMGLKRSGKTSVRKVVFQKMSPNETLFVESTARITNEYMSDSFVNFETIEFPGQIDPFETTAFDSSEIFNRCGALIFVIDAQADYEEALKRMIPAITRAYTINKNIKFEVFVHKVDGLSEETKMETHRRIFQTVQDDLADQGMDHIRVSYHMTSIYDHSIYEAFSKVIQKLIYQLSTLESLLDIFNQGSNVEKSFLFDVASKIYIATDSSPVDMATYELCCDMIDVTIDLSSIYGQQPVVQPNPKHQHIEGLIGAGTSEQPPLMTGFDPDGSAIITLRTRQVIFLRQINRYLALVSVIKEDNFERQGMIDFNFNVFKKGVEDVFELSRKRYSDGGIPSAINSSRIGSSGDADSSLASTSY